MDNNNGSPPPPPPPQGGEPSMETGDWRSQLQSDSRRRIVNKIMDTLKRLLPFSHQEGLHELEQIAVRFEEKIYTAATSQSDYLRKISLKMLTMETKSQNTMANSLQTDSAGNSYRLPKPDLMDNDIADWRTSLMPVTRARIVNKIAVTLKRHVPFSSQDGELTIERIAARFEEKMYTAASSQSDYLRKISLKMLAVETKGGSTTTPSNLKGHRVLAFDIDL